ncbi:zinc knuckle CX2CX4HX4C containing protein, partial [Tanacetum coccineum]
MWEKASLVVDEWSRKEDVKPRRILMIGNVRTFIMEEAHTTKYSVRLGVNETVARHGVHVSSNPDKDGMYIEVLERDVEVVRNTSRYEKGLRKPKIIKRVKLIVEMKLLGFSVGDHVMMKVSPWKGVVRFDKKGELVPRFREMEAGFLLGNNAAKKGSLASKVKNIEGKLLGKDGKPLKSCLKNASSKPIQVKPVGEEYTKSVDSVTKLVLNSWLVVDVANKIGVADESNASRSMQATPKKVQVSVLTNDVKVIGANVAIPIYVVEEMCDKFTNTLYGYFLGERLAFPIVEAYVSNAWKKYGFERAICRNAFFFFKFSSHDDMIKTLKGGPWFIRSSSIFLYKWLARKLLQGYRLDACTNDMCLNTWGRTSYARFLVEFNSESEVMESIVVAIPLPKDEGHYLEILDVEYEWWPPRCSKCRIFNHEDYDCPLLNKHAK